MLNNKLGITNQVELAKAEERISKANAKRLYDSGDINDLEIGTYNLYSRIVVTRSDKTLI